ncbi:YcaO-like family protein [Escherichia coli]
MMKKSLNIPTSKCTYRSSGLISWDLFKQDADYPFVDWSFSGTTEEEFATLMAIFKKEDKEVYIADYEHLGVDACRIIVPGMSDIYPAGDLWLANNSMGSHSRETIFFRYQVASGKRKIT